MNLARMSCMCALAIFSLAVPARAEDEPKQEKKEKGPGWLWIDGEGGIETANLTTFNANVDTLTAGLTPSSGVGPAAGVGAGVRLWFLTLGLRGRVGAMETADANPWQLWTLDAEGGLRVKVAFLEPYLLLAGGYTSVGNFKDAASGLRQGLDISGANIRLGAGLDVYVTRHVSINANLSAETLILARQGVALRDLAEAKMIGTLDDAKARVLETSGSSAGAALTATAGVGLHF